MMWDVNSSITSADNTEKKLIYFQISQAEQFCIIEELKEEANSTQRFVLYSLADINYTNSEPFKRSCLQTLFIREIHNN